MKDEIKTIQKKLIDSLKRLDVADENITEEVARSNAISQLANTYIKTCNLIIRVEDAKDSVKKKIDGVKQYEK